MKLYHRNTVSQFLGDQQVARQRVRFAGAPAGNACKEFACIFPLCDRAGVRAVSLTGIAEHAAEARLPRRYDRRFVVVNRNSSQVRLGPQITEIVAAHRRRSCELPSGKTHRSAGKLNRRRFVDKGASRDHERVLRKQPRQLFRVIREEDSSPASMSNVAQQIGIGIGGLAEANHADGDPGLLALRDEFLILTRLL